jgi:hypothetical protein
MVEVERSYRGLEHELELGIYKDLNGNPETISMKVFLNKFEPNSCIIMRAGTGKGLSAAPMLFHRGNMQLREKGPRHRELRSLHFAYWGVPTAR